MQICALRLMETAHAFYSATPELRDHSLTWQDFKASFLGGFETSVPISFILPSSSRRDEEAKKLPVNS